MDMVHKDIDVLLSHLKSDDGVDKELKSELMYMRTIFKFQHFIFSGYLGFLGDTITEKIFEEVVFYSPSCRTSKECMVNYVDSLVSFMIQKGRQASSFHPHTSMESPLKNLQSIKKATRRCLSTSTLVPIQVLEEKLRVMMDSLHVKASTAVLTRIQALADSAADLCFTFWVKMSEHFLDTGEISDLLYLRDICKERVPPLEIKEAGQSQTVLLDVCKRLELVKGLVVNLPKQYLKPQDKIKHLFTQIAALTSKTRYHSLEEGMAARVNDELGMLLENSKEICLDFRKLLHSGFPLIDDWGMIDTLVMSLNERLNFKADLVNRHEVEKIKTVVQQGKGKKFGSLRERIFKTVYEADYVIDSMNLDNDPPPYLDSYLSDIIMEANIIHNQILDIGVQTVKFGEAVESSDPLSSLVNTPSDDNVLGFKKEEEAIKEQLLSGLRKLVVISIVGVSGLGKTTLANKIYNDQNVINHFQVCAWCCVSQEYNKTKLLCEIYSQVTEDELTEEMQRLIKENRESKVTEVDLAENFSKFVMDKRTRRKVTETDVAEKLQNFLKEKKYLIVLDDIWESRACDEIIRCFPTEENGSRIMLTTRFDEVAHNIKLHSDPHYLPLFTTEESWELLQWKAFQNERRYPELLEIGKEISQSCRGLPLSIVLVAGLLTSIKREERLWSEVAETLSSVDSDHKMHMLILGLIYKHLPDRLKSCLLFFAAFPEDQEVAVSKLVQLWAAEGFVVKIEGKSLEDVAEDYLNNLFSGGLITVSKRRYDGSIISFRVHNTIHEFCSEKARKERFLMISSTNNQIPMWDLACHRICFNHQDIECQNPLFSWMQWNLSVRTVLCISRRRDPHLSKAIDFSQISHRLRLIRVLDLESITVGNAFFSVIQRLPHLRFIAVHTGYFNFVFPSSLGNLQNLETLKIKTEVQCMVLPKSISNMVKLRQLDITDSFQFGIDEEDSCLKNIQALSTVVLSNKQSIGVMTRLFPLLQRLKCIYIGSNETSPESNEFLELEKLYQLESLHVSYDGPLERRDHIVFKFPWNLKKLILNGFSLPAYEISKVALIPTLVALKLQNVHFKDHQWDVEKYDFPQLNYLKLHNCSIVYWSALTSSFPCLKRVILRQCIVLKELPSCFGNIATLEAVEVYRCNSSLEHSVFKLKIQSEAANRSTPLRIRILKSENLQIFYSLDPKKSSAGVSQLPENVVDDSKFLLPPPSGEFVGMEEDEKNKSDSCSQSRPASPSFQSWASSKIDALLGRSFKPAKFKATANLAISRLAVLKNQRQVRCSIARSDVVQLLILGQHHRALLRVEQVMKEQNMLDVFGIVEGYCYLLTERVNQLEHEKVCPDELKEAVSGLIFAATRCGEFPELQELRAIFSAKFGKEFTARAVELMNNCGVNPQMVQKLSTRLPSQENRLKVLKEIAKENDIVVQIEESDNENEATKEEKEDWGGGIPNYTKMKVKGKYKDVADAAQAAFESAAYAAAAARAAVELSRSDGDVDDGGFFSFEGDFDGGLFDEIQPPKTEEDKGVVNLNEVSTTIHHSKDSNREYDGSRKRNAPRWTQKVQVSPGTGLEGHLDDGYSWRKYGQKDILGAKYPRYYYRCTHRNVQGCLATKQVQRSDEDPTMFDITYRGRHTCNQAGGNPNPPPATQNPPQNQEPNMTINPFSQQGQPSETVEFLQTTKRLINELAHGKDAATRLQMIHNAPASSFSPETRELLVHNVLSSYDRALSLLNYLPEITPPQPPPPATGPAFGMESPSSFTGSPHSEDSDREYNGSHKRHEFYQKPEEVVVTIFAKGIPAKNVSIEFGEQILSITIDVAGGDAYTFQPRLFGKIIPEKCRYEVMSTKIEIRLAKAEAIHWTSLEYSREVTVVQKPNVLPSESKRPSYPSSIPKRKDWDKLEAQVKKEEKEEKLDGDAALNKFFRDIYKDADEDTRRAMMISFGL